MTLFFSAESVDYTNGALAGATNREEIHMRNLVLSTGTFDRTNSFTIAHPRKGYLPMRCSLHQDFDTRGDGIFWAMQSAGCIQSSYSQEELDETRRLNAMVPLQDKDLVTIQGAQYRVTLKGDYSDAAIFQAVHEDIAEIDRLRSTERARISPQLLAHFDQRTLTLKFAKKRQICAQELAGVGQEMTV